MVFDEIAYEDGTFAGYTAEDRTPADGLITGIGEIDGREIFFTANDCTVKAGSLGAQGIEKEIRLAERAVTARAPIVRLIDSTGARLTPGEREKSDSHADRYVAGSPFSTSVSTQDRSHRSGCSTGRTSPDRPTRRCSVTFLSWSRGSRGWPSPPPASFGR